MLSAPARRLLAAAALALGAATAHADEWSPNLTLNGIWHDNASNAESTSDQIDSLQLGADVVGWNDYKFGQGDLLRLTLHFAADWWPRYDALLAGAAGGRAAWQHTFGPTAFAPVFTAEIGADAFETKESGRRGTLATLELALRKRLDANWRVALMQRFEQRDASAAVYDADAAETTLEVAYDLSSQTRLTLSGIYRAGDVLTYSGNPRGEVAAIAAAQREVDTFGRPMTVYSVDARTWGARVALLRALDASTAIVAAYDWRSTEKNPVQFSNQMISVGFVHQF